MGVFVIAILAGYLFCTILLGFIMLKFFLNVSATTLNLTVFIMGSILGAVVLSVVVNYFERRIGWYPSFRDEGTAALIIFFVGALGGGSAISWVKKSLTKRR